MIPIQPLLILFIGGILVYFLQFRSRLLDRLIALVFASASALLIFHPEFSNRIAHRIGVGRGVDLIFYLALPGFGFACLLLFSKTLELRNQVTVLTREIALLSVQKG